MKILTTISGILRRNQTASKPSQKNKGSRRGFASMDPEQQREIARRGGQASHEYGRGHEFTPQEAREAGRRGGRARWERLRT